MQGPLPLHICRPCCPTPTPERTQKNAIVQHTRPHTNANKTHLLLCDTRCHGRCFGSFGSVQPSWLTRLCQLSLRQACSSHTQHQSTTRSVTEKHAAHTHGTHTSCIQTCPAITALAATLQGNVVRNANTHPLPAQQTTAANGPLASSPCAPSTTQQRFNQEKPKEPAG